MNKSLLVKNRFIGFTIRVIVIPTTLSIWFGKTLISFLSSVFIPNNTPSHIDSFSVLNSDFEVIRRVDNPDIASKLLATWKNFNPVKTPSDNNWVYKIDIQGTKDIKGRWLYSSDGYISRLNYMLKPTYKVDDIKAFEELLFGK